MNRNRTFGKILIICGSVLTIIGITLLLAKGSSRVLFMSLAIIFPGMIIWHNTEKVSSGPEKGLNDW
jgi:hypothetical protein